MPYIKYEIRERYDKSINNLIKIFKDQNSDKYSLDLDRKTDGEMNYIITRLLDETYSNLGYSEYNRAVGVLECVKLELYRRRIAVYEDIKKNMQGDVYKNV